MYEGNMIDYMGETVTSANFLKILTGKHVEGVRTIFLDNQPQQLIAHYDTIIITTTL